LRVVENLLLAAFFVFCNAWCVGWAYAFVHLAGALVGDSLVGRTLAAVAALSGVAFGIWTLYRAWRFWRWRR